MRTILNKELLRELDEIDELECDVMNTYPINGVHHLLLCKIIFSEPAEISNKTLTVLGEVSKEALVVLEKHDCFIHDVKVSFEPVIEDLILPEDRDNFSCEKSA
ncbi:hypothetical protein L0B53_12610 [Vibrio sp. SS-MA-C1-2]|uniref:hypothetical protein n=1 Tax=Vibrio sp. SS-MA-C1-2 TaxID=2908646 RepID=UPI001F3BFD0A|nr:hypothetical protein [Vibrio sp. SS-MA-C1-2]UJF17867.1 hypothetical protein L0B53_12610 [Vibrio sp. SS-MA-C1-2]